MNLGTLEEAVFLTAVPSLHFSSLHLLAGLRSCNPPSYTHRSVFFVHLHNSTINFGHFIPERNCLPEFSPSNLSTLWSPFVSTAMPPFSGSTSKAASLDASLGSRVRNASSQTLTMVLNVHHLTGTCLLLSPLVNTCVLHLLLEVVNSGQAKL